ncbi:Xaa-Pro aminopeptidase-like protein [Elsinoe australis]|uniref:Xaa-Pro aminopeptidase n=1 Tax=Elsinoe australis TaxID=40998 RepID=A0A4U7AWA8_9PEZI|nr:Xaa-Pro aminopeptidase-like protein [Elsinoe australis]
MLIKITAESVLDKYPAKQHARRVSRELGVKEGLIYLQAAPTKLLEDSDQYREFRQRRYFYYLTGANEADCHVTYDIGRDELVLWLAPFTPTQVVWVGRGSTISEALDKYNVDDARYATGLPTYISKWTSSNSARLYLLHPNQRPPFPDDIHLDAEGSPAQSMLQRLDVKHLQPAMDACRVIKDEYEVRLIKRANEISGRAHTAVLRNIRKFKSEAQVAALVLDVSTSNGAPHQAYSIIAGSGSNGAVLHYTSNNAKFGDSQSMCLDAGAEYQCYASDVTRTFPLNGHWSSEAKQIYDIVQEMQDQALSMIKPGFRLFQAQLVCHAILVDRLLQIGILHNGTRQEILESSTSLAFYPHGLGHHLGLEVHDVAPMGAGIRTEEHPFSHLIGTYAREPSQLSSKGLEPGMVVTVEPGIYFNRYALDNLYLNKPEHAKYINTQVLERYMSVGGVRIEDDVLVTETGYKNLTTAPKGEAALRIIRGEA